MEQSKVQAMIAKYISTLFIFLLPLFCNAQVIIIKPVDSNFYKLPIAEEEHRTIFSKQGIGKKYGDWRDSLIGLSTGTVTTGTTTVIKSKELKIVKKYVPPKYHDSTYYTYSHDTLFGKVEYKVNYDITVKGEGIMVKNETWEYHTMVPQKPPVVQHFTINGVEDSVITMSGSFGILNYKSTLVFIKTEKGYKRAEDKAIFTPN